MADTLKYHIDHLKQTSTIASDPNFLEILNSIDTFSNNDSDRAYFLGHFFKYKLDSSKLHSTDKTFLIDIIKSNNLDKYFYLKSKPDSDNYGKLIYLFIVVGIIGIISGTIQLINNNYSYGLGTKYLVSIIREGGHKIILGLVFFVGGLIRLKYETRKSKFLKSFY
jgi:hypothetical protein